MTVNDQKPDMFSLASTAIDSRSLLRTLEDPACGAIATFEGRVRNHNDGHSVIRLDYEAYPDMAVTEGNTIVREAMTRFGVTRAIAVHRVGTLEIGDIAVWIGVAAGHRDEAFQACRYIIEEIKKRLPVWKKEVMDDASAVWLEPAPPAAATTIEAAYYQRQIRMPEVGETGQAKLRAASVLVVGAGGLGCPAAQYLAAAGIGRIRLCDGDRVDPTNLHRQILFGPGDVGRPKATAAAARLRQLNPYITIEALDAKVEPGNVMELVGGCDIVLDCTDNFAAKFLLHDACHLAHRTLVQASIHRLEGQLQVFRPGSGAGCMRCLWPEMPDPGCVGSCAEVGIIGVVPGVLGCLQASEAIKCILGIDSEAARSCVLVDLAAPSTRSIARPRDPACPLCGPAASIGSIVARNYTAAPPASDLIVDAKDLTPERLAGHTIVDLREPGERRGAPEWIQRITNLPMSAADALARLPKDGVYLLVCAAGYRSRIAAEALRAHGLPNVYSLRQGIDALEPLLARQPDAGSGRVAT